MGVVFIKACYIHMKLSKTIKTNKTKMVRKDKITLANCHGLKVYKCISTLSACMFVHVCLMHTQKGQKRALESLELVL